MEFPGVLGLKISVGRNTIIWSFYGWSLILSEISKGKVKTLKKFFGIAHSVSRSLGHLELHFWLCQPQTRKATVL